MNWVSAFALIFLFVQTSEEPVKFIFRQQHIAPFSKGAVVRTQCTVIERSGNLYISERIQPRNTDHAKGMLRRGVITWAQWRRLIELTENAGTREIAQPPPFEGLLTAFLGTLISSSGERKIGYVLWSDPSGPLPSRDPERFKIEQEAQKLVSPVEAYLAELAGHTVEVPVSSDIPAECK